jgi:hypothetical protein
MHIGTFEQELDPADFFRISRKFIPLKAIKEIVVYSNSFESYFAFFIKRKK